MWSSPLTGQTDGSCDISVCAEDKHDYSDPDEISDDPFADSPPGMTAMLQEQMGECLNLTLDSSAVFSTQIEITPQVRFSVIDWLTKITERLKYKPTTLYNTVYLIDYVLSKRICTRDDIQLVAVTCLWMSAKVEEVKTSDLEVCVIVCQRKIPGEKFVAMEKEIGSILNWRVCYPTPFTFLEAILTDLGKEACLETALFFLDISTYVINLMDIPAHYRAAAVAYAGILGSGETPHLARLCSLVDVLRPNTVVEIASGLAEAANRMASHGFCGKWAAYSDDEKLKLNHAIQLARRPITTRSASSCE